MPAAQVKVVAAEVNVLPGVGKVIVAADGAGALTPKLVLCVVMLSGVVRDGFSGSA